MNLLVFALALLLASGVAALAFYRFPRAAAAIGSGGIVAGCLIGSLPAILMLAGAPPESLRLPWDGIHGTFSLGLDPLSAFFLLPLFGLSALAAVYGGKRLPPRDGTSTGASWFLFSALVAGMATVLVARTAVLFLIAWEAMSLAAYGLVASEHAKMEARRAGWIFLVVAHLGAATLLFAFALLGRHAGSLDFEAFRTMPPLGAGAAGAVFALFLAGFGAKAGLIPFHIWMPGAYAAAPSHASALMAGAMVKLGLYGLLRGLTFLGPPAPWWGTTLAGLGLLSALAGITLALVQRDVKRILAYSSVENMGLIALALGMGLWGSASGRPAVALLGVVAALFHAWNHMLMKTLLFFAAGSVQGGAGGRDLEALGGLMKRMPWTACALVVGAVAIAPLPPLNGFAGKWMIYLGLARFGLASGGGDFAALLAAGLLALTGGLAAIAFARLAGVALLGSPRDDAAGAARESSPWMLAPMFVLAALCLAAAIAPQRMADWTFGAADQILRLDPGRTRRDWGSAGAPLEAIGAFNTWTLAALAAGVLALLAWSRRAPRSEGPTWGCGYVQPTPRMQYTGRSFSGAIEQMLPRALRTRAAGQVPVGLFPSGGGLRPDPRDPIAGTVYEPLFRGAAERLSRLRVLQHGKLNVYLAYIGIAVAAVLAWATLRPGGAS